MTEKFYLHNGLWQRWAPPKLQAAVSLPTPVAKGTTDDEGNYQDFVGRIELVIGRLGAGKTTWASLRANRLARASGRELATNGMDWPAPWRSITTFEEMEALRGVVFCWDELHLMMPSSRGLLPAEVERFLIRWLSLCRKRDICVVGTTQAWTRCATHYRQLVTTVWKADFQTRGVLHFATPFEHPDDGGMQVFARQWFGPGAANIPTKASVWRGYDIEDDSSGFAVPIVGTAGGVRRAAPAASVTTRTGQPVSPTALRPAHNMRVPGPFPDPGTHIEEDVTLRESKHSLTV